MRILTTISRANFLLLKTNYSTQKYKSALFIPGNRASETFSLLTPYLDFDKRFADIKKLEQELILRNINKINARELKKSWDYYKEIDLNRKIIEKKRDELSHEITKLYKKNELNSIEINEIESLKLRGTILREDLKNIKDILWEIEETVVVQALKLPNEIDDKTPLEPVILRTVGQIPKLTTETTATNHLDIGELLKLIQYKSPMHYYLCNEAAHFEIGALTWASNILTTEEIIRVSGADFSRSLVVEAAGLNHYNPLETFILENNEDIDVESCNRLHLIGGASLIAFLTMHTKQLINPKHFPLRYYATGRQYCPFNDDKLLPGLFGVCQSSVVHCLSMVQDPMSQQYQEQLQNTISAALKLYDNLGKHYRVVLRSAEQLKSWESLRISFEMWSMHLQDYIEVGYISCCGDYFTKRLLIAYQTSSGRGYPAIISGTILSIPRLLGCLIEENPAKFEIPKCIVPHIADDKD